jgi:hypothetical protein
MGAGMERREKTNIISFIQDHSRPLIGFNKDGEYVGAGYDSETFRAHLDEGRPLSDYKPIEITVQREDALRYDFYTLVDCIGLLSKKAVDVLGEDMLANYTKLPAFLNGAPYFALAVSQTTDCLDLENSVYERGDETHPQFFSIAHYAFHWHKIELERWFTIPQKLDYTLCTQRVVEKIRRTDLVGFGYVQSSVDE